MWLEKRPCHTHLSLIIGKFAIELMTEFAPPRYGNSATWPNPLQATSLLKSCIPPFIKTPSPVYWCHRPDSKPVRSAATSMLSLLPLGTEMHAVVSWRMRRELELRVSSHVFVFCCDCGCFFCRSERIPVCLDNRRRCRCF